MHRPVVKAVRGTVSGTWGYVSSFLFQETARPEEIAEEKPTDDFAFIEMNDLANEGSISDEISALELPESSNADLSEKAKSLSVNVDAEHVTSPHPAPLTPVHIIAGAFDFSSPRLYQSPKAAKPTSFKPGSDHQMPVDACCNSCRLL